MTTQETITILLANGWRHESLGPGLETLLTNAPPNLTQCPQCLSWQHNKQFPNPLGICMGCNGKPYATRPKKSQRRIICKRGHTVIGRNMYLRPDGYTACRTCRRLTDKRTS